MTVSSVISPAARQAADWLKHQVPARARLSSDSRTLAAGDVFVAYPGETSDGRAYIGRALAAGAAALVLEKSGADAFLQPLGQTTVPSLQVEGLRSRAGEVAAAYLDEPTAGMTVVAVTGTNGKTSCTHWIAQGYNDRAAARADTSERARAAVIGTLGAGVPGELAAQSRGTSPEQSPLTTPDAIGLQQQFATFAGQGVELVAMEASSIGLQQGRLNGSRIAVAVLTNLTRDHLDYHVTMQAYASAKAKLFTWPTLVATVVNLEDPASAEMLNAADPDLRRIGYLVNDAIEVSEFSDGSDSSDSSAGAPAAALADAGERSTSCSDLLTATPIDGQGRVVLTHLRAREMDEPGGGAVDEDDSDAVARSVDLQLSLIGRFNLSNALAVAGVWLSLGWSLEEVAAQLEMLRPVPGRLQVVRDVDVDVDVGAGAGVDVDVDEVALPLAVVDYAHTPDAIANALQALRPIAATRGGRLWCVFGAGGNRDAGKRAPMAAAAEAHADVLVLTSDNPRDEAPEAIIAQLLSGLARPPHRVEADRGRAIASALRSADAADVVLIAGKGHESYQEIAGKRYLFSDVEKAREALQERRATSGEPGGAADV